jgi:hypothetical protein
MRAGLGLAAAAAALVCACAAQLPEPGAPVDPAAALGLARAVQDAGAAPSPVAYAVEGRSALALTRLLPADGARAARLCAAMAAYLDGPGAGSGLAHVQVRMADGTALAWREAGQDGCRVRPPRPA